MKLRKVWAVDPPLGPPMPMKQHIQKCTAHRPEKFDIYLLLYNVNFKYQLGKYHKIPITNFQIESCDVCNICVKKEL